MLKPLFILLLLFFYSCHSITTSPCILQATYDGAPSKSSFIFNADGTFEWIHGWALSTSESDGRFTIKDSIITLDKIGFDKIN